MLLWGAQLVGWSFRQTPPWAPGHHLRFSCSNSFTILHINNTTSKLEWLKYWSINDIKNPGHKLSAWMQQSFLKAQTLLCFHDLWSGRVFTSHLHGDTVTHGQNLHLRARRSRVHRLTGPFCVGFLLPEPKHTSRVHSDLNRTCERPVVSAQRSLPLTEWTQQPGNLDRRSGRTWMLVLWEQG